MPTDTAATSAATLRRRRQRQRQRQRQRETRLGSSLPAWILLNRDPYIGSRSNDTTAIGEGRDNSRIEVSLWPSPPPLSSNVYLFCPGIEFPEHPAILYTAEDLLLLRIPVAMDEFEEQVMIPKDCDYIIYRPGKSRSLQLIPNPEPRLFLDEDVCILPRGGGGELYTIAALVDTSQPNQYELYRFDSEVGSWTSKVLSMEAPRKPYPVKIPNNTGRLHLHITSTVIPLGGEAGTMGWVDLWSGILLYDLLREEDPDRPPTVRHMPLPLPMCAITFNHGLGLELGEPRPVRGIAACFKSGKATCLKLAELQRNWECLPSTDIETGLPVFIAHGWSVTIWSNNNMAADSSFEDWHQDFKLHASEIKISDAMRSELLSAGLLHRKPSQHGDNATELALHNLFVSEPAPSMNGEEDVVFLMARPKFLYPKVWALSLDMKSGTLLGASEFGTEKDLRGGVFYHPSTISSYMNLETTTVYNWNLKIGPSAASLWYFVGAIKGTHVDDDVCRANSGGVSRSVGVSSES
ncbi:hypothetical protein ACP4OV_007007 [Aristida adscensionis]